jgi:hypothetical protein
MLKTDPQERLSARECVVPVSELYMATLPASDDETEVMAPTEEMPSTTAAAGGNV